MGKKARLKREKRKADLEEKLLEVEETKEKPRFLLMIIRFSIYLSIFTPLILSSKYYFPFVGPKSLYFMGFVEIAFFSWLFLILQNKEYRPRLNSLLLCLFLFISVIVLSAIFGVDFSRSFWSKFERMTGVLMWLHLGAFFLVLSSVFRTYGDWERIFNISVFVALLVSLNALFEKLGVSAFKFSDRGGATLGNTSFLGTYLLFNIFLAFWLFWQKRNPGLKFYYFAFIVLAFSMEYFQSARAATISTIGGFGLILLLWLSFYPYSSKIKIAGRVLLVLSSLLVFAAVVLLFIPSSPVQQKFIELASKARIVNWEMAQRAFFQRPLLGWGPENYTLAFNEFFNPCLFLGECGGEIWFDRSHNIVFDTLATLGIIGLLVYLGIFVRVIYLAFKEYKREIIDFWTFSIFISMLIAYFIQNLTVFDMVTSLMMFILSLGFAAFWEIKDRETQKTAQTDETGFGQEEREIKVSKAERVIKAISSPLIFLGFLLSFLVFVVQPLRTDKFVILALSPDFETRLNFYQKALQTSPLGKYQIREFFGQFSEAQIRRNFKDLPKDQIKEELDFVIGELEKTKQESPLDLRSILRLAYLYNIYSLIDPQKNALAEQNAQRAIELSPRNQQGYWALAQIKATEGKFNEAFDLSQKAIDLEPRLYLSYSVALKIAKFAGNEEKVRDFIEQAAKINSDWPQKLYSEVFGTTTESQK